MEELYETPAFKIITVLDKKTGEAIKIKAHRFNHDLHEELPAAPKKEAKEEEEEEVKEEEEEVEPGWLCNVCGKVCKSRAGLNSHMRSHK